MKPSSKTNAVIYGLCGLFVVLLIAFSLDLFGDTREVEKLPLVDPKFLTTETWRRSYADLVKSDGDVDMFDCYFCHEENVRLTLKFDDNNQLIIPEEHEDLKMDHGAHGRNNNCFNCHDDENLVMLQARDQKKLSFEESSQLCGSCHGPTKEDWDAGAHGRISGFWNREMGPRRREDCVNCHNPHHPKFPSYEPAPAPNHLHEPSEKDHSNPSSHGS